MSDKVIEVKGLVKRYKKQKENAVDNISFNVNAGEFFAFLGPNGAGKTTTISILTTTLGKTRGKVTIAGFDIDRQSQEVRRNIGVIFQNPSLDLNLTAEENIRFHACLYGIHTFAPTFSLMSADYKKKVFELAEIIGIKKVLGDPVKSFSGGMKRKLEIIRSLMHNPKVLFLDEPTSGLDPGSRKNLWEYLSLVRKTQNTTMFLTTHYLEEAEDVDRLAIITQGRIIAEGTPEKLKRDLTDDYLLVNAKDKTKLTKELEQKNIQFISLGSNYKIDINGHTAQEIISQIKTPLSNLKIVSPTLEEAYLKLIA